MATSQTSDGAAETPSGQSIDAIVGPATGMLGQVLGQISSIAKQGVNYMLCVVGAGILAILAIAGFTGEGDFSTAEFIALAAAATIIALIGAGFRALAAQSSLNKSIKVSESAFDLARKALDHSERAQEQHSNLTN